jgi:hypothetical protein
MFVSNATIGALLAAAHQYGPESIQQNIVRDRKDTLVVDH